jgi:hypothetical protein
MDRSETADAFNTIHEALMACRDLAVDDVDREGEVVSPAARYRLKKVQEALALARRGLEPGTAAVRFLIDLAIDRLVTLPVGRWGEEVHYLLEGLMAKANLSDYAEFLKQLQAAIEEKLEEVKDEGAD